MKLEDIDNIFDEIQKRKQRIIPVSAPTQLKPGSIEIDHELFKLAENLKILNECIYLCGIETNRKKHDYQMRYLKELNKIDEEEMDNIGITKSLKDKVAKLRSSEDEKSYEKTKNQLKYFQGVYATYIEWMNLYKKVRMLGE